MYRNYRPEIDGLRAIAVASVILYHAKFLIFEMYRFGGGYIGVDIFFVISGYLITRLMLIEIENSQSFSFLDFYKRRARRILPVLFLVMLMSFPLAWEFLMPSGFVEYSQSIISSLLFGSNFFFYYATTEYGADSSLIKPFLHTWSLSVEEQFYIIFPIFLVVIHKFFRNYLLVILLVVFFLSLQFSALMGGRDPDLNFYLPFSRFWEILAGSVLAYFEMRHGRVKNKIMGNVFPIIGLYLIAYSIFYFNSETRHPGFETLIPVVGVSLIIVFSSQDDLVGKALSLKPIVGVGLISYSLYLWHFPIFAFARMNSHTPTNYEKVVWVAIALVLSILSYFFVEKRFRRSDFMNARLYWPLLFSVFLIIVGINVWAIESQGFKHRLPTIPILSNYNFDNKFLDKQHLEWAKNYNSISPTHKEGKINALIVGNSHARDLLSAFLRNQNSFEDFYFNRGRIPQISCFDKRFSHDENHANVKRFYSSEEYLKSDLIVVSTRFREQQKCSSKNANPPEASDFTGLQHLMDQVKRDGKKIIVFGNNIEISKINGQLVTDHLLSNLIIRESSISIKDLDDFKVESSRLTWEKMSSQVGLINQKVKIIASQSNVPYFDKVGILCENETCITLTPSGHKILWDSDHFTMEGAEFFGKRMYAKGVKDVLLSTLK